MHFSFTLCKIKKLYSVRDLWPLVHFGGSIGPFSRSGIDFHHTCLLVVFSSYLFMVQR